MTRLVEALLATGIAALAHVGAFGLLPDVTEQAASAEAAGEGGEDLISLAPADVDLLALIAEWETPPTVVPEPVEVTPSAPEAPPALPAAEPAPEPPASAAVALPAAEPPPPKPEPVPDVKEETPEKAPEQALETAAEKVNDPPAEPKPEKSQTAPPPQPDLKAKGKGEGQASGEAGKDAAATLDKAALKKAMAGWGAEIRARIERRKSYPAAADGATGKVVVRLVVGADGRLRSVGVAKSSGNAALDKAAVAAVRAAGRFPKAPAGVGEQSFTLPISFGS